MKGLLASALVLMAGCGFNSPESSSAQADAGDNGSPPGSTPQDAPPAARCSTYSYSYNGHKYRMVDTAISWTDASNNCASDGGYLLKIESSGEDNQAAYLISGPSEIWIGLRDGTNTGSYVWTDNTPPTFTHWGAAPNAASPDCVVKNTLVTDGRWYPRDCTSTRAVVCECNP